jgi:hypothetical protein
MKAGNWRLAPMKGLAARAQTGPKRTHRSRRILHFDKEGFLKRHNYDIEIAGGTRGAHYTDAYVAVSGIKFPTVHRIFVRQEDPSVNREPLVVSIDVSNNQLAKRVERTSRGPASADLFSCMGLILRTKNVSSFPKFRGS